MNTDPESRYTIDQIKAHPWYQQCKDRPFALDAMYDGVHLNEGVIKKVVGYGYNEEYVKNCLSQNKHNHATTTYYLALKSFDEKPDLVKEKEL